MLLMLILADAFRFKRICCFGLQGVVIFFRYFLIIFCLPDDVGGGGGGRRRGLNYEGDGPSTSGSVVIALF